MSPKRREVHALMLATLIALPLLIVPASADEPAHTIAEPGFRPPSDRAAIFVSDIDNTTIAVLPTIIRRRDRTAHSFDSQMQIIDHLKKTRTGVTVRKPKRIELGPLRRPTQWLIFQYGAESIVAELEGYETSADYTLVMEILTPDNQSVFGIELYILDRERQHVFSFLLNSHHTLFANAGLVSKGSSEADRARLIGKATSTAMTALDAQVKAAKECLASKPAKIPKAEAGLLRGFERDLHATIDSHEVPLGYSTFNDEQSVVAITTTAEFPPASFGAAGNRVLEMRLDVKGWAGFVETFTSETGEAWLPRDWSAADGLSFRLYGNNSGTKMFVDVLDNRNTCSQRDDAERFTFEFWDDVPGWRLVSVPFTSMARKEIWNGAPNDGFGLTEVHGWAVGTAASNGPKTFYIDELRLWVDTDPDAAGEREVISHRLFEETRLDAHTSRLSMRPDTLTGLAVEKAMDLACECARLATDRGFRYYRMDERAMEAGGRATFRLTFFESRPEGIPVIDDVIGKEISDLPPPMSAALDAEEYDALCDQLKAMSRHAE